MAEAASHSAELLGADGPFAEHLEGFSPRVPQLELAAAVESTLAEGGLLVAEAGTGIGKTLAYLVPVLTSGRRTIISTGTKNLQDQLYFRDLPLVRKALDAQVVTALLKGRSNYLCLYRMEQTRERGEFPSRLAAREMEGVLEWSTVTRDGDLSNATVISDESGLWPLVTSTTDNCLGSSCPRYDDCHLLKARRQAQEADVVVVNHHLLFADMAIKQGGFGEVLPGADAFVVDEAHQAPELASRFFSSGLSARQVRDLCRDILAESAETSGGLGSVREPVADCEQALKALQAAVSQHLDERGSWVRFIEHEAVRLALQQLDQAVADLEPPLKGLQGASRGLDACIERRAALQTQFDRLDAPSSAGEVRWFERRGRGFGLHITPLDISDIFAGYREELEAAWVFTSATLSVNGAFAHFTKEMGLEEADTLALDSPFDYPRNALMWLPELRLEPRDPEYLPTLLDQVLPVLEASRGRAFLLFTSHRALQAAAGWLEERTDFLLLVQGSLPRSLLLERFRESDNALLLGTASFWEGVDVMGEALSVVVIDKLPFAAPDDPVLEAMGERLRSEGANPFMALSLPQAVIALKQGAGRLIRDVHDRGVLVLCDPRIQTKAYGSWFLDSLPPMQRTTNRREAIEFFLEPVDTALP